jgi:2-polyprenyl-3-methyl-5-hydroxy-6-metoxy-1,4-benzoquinol methylase
VFEEFGVTILRCAGCGHVFSNYAGDPHFEGFWGTEVPEGEHFYWSKARARMHGDFRRRFLDTRSGRLLDMGCGLGFFLKTLASSDRWEGYGCEISPAAVHYARNTLGLKNVVVGRLQDVNLPEHSFDIITMWDVLDHVLHPDPLLTRCSELLKHDGVLFIRIPNVFNQLLRARVKKALRGVQPGVAYMMSRDHFHHYSQKSIRTLLMRNGFQRVEFTHLHPIEGVSKSGPVVRGLKRLSFQGVRGLAFASMGHLNFDNLFVIAKKK